MRNSDIVLGQCWVNERLYYSVPPPQGGDHEDFWFQSDHTTIPLKDLAAHIPGCSSPWGSDALKRLLAGSCQPTDAAVNWTDAARSSIGTGQATVEVDQLFDRLRALVTRFYWTPDENFYDLFVLFVMSTYVYTVCSTVPHLHVMGVYGSGKSTLAELATLLCFEPLSAADCTGAALLSAMSNRRGTLILDEQDGRMNRRLRVALRATNRCSATSMVVEAGRAVRRNVFSPLFIVTNGPLADGALATRVIPHVSERGQGRCERLVESRIRDEITLIRDQLFLFGLLQGKHVSEQLKVQRWVGELPDREADIASLPRAVAALIDGQSNRNIHERLVSHLSKVARDRYLLKDEERESLVSSVANFVSTNRPDDEEGDDRYYAAENVFNHVRKDQEISTKPSDTRGLTELLNRHGLVKARRRIRLRKRSHLVEDTTTNSIQRTCICFTKEVTETSYDQD
jgi:hypothetical protein